MSERVLLARHSAFNQIVVTEDDVGLRTLRFGHDGVPQSIVKLGDPEHFELPYASVLPLCLAFVEKPVRILIVGLGGGTAPGFFHSRFPELAVDVVEIDEEVLEVAKTYCGFTEDARMHVFVEDGRDFIENCRSRYDLIILDSFDSESIPRHLLTLEFLTSVRNALTPEGIAVANVWGRAINRLYDDMLLTYREAFEEVYILDVPVPGTKIFLALPRKQEMTREQLVQRAREISTQRGLRRDLSNSIAGFRNSDAEHRRGGTVLRDVN
ncbi:MAG: fused MFS/spermidine synthase [Verrucomicrobiota bacterium]